MCYRNTHFTHCSSRLDCTCVEHMLTCVKRRKKWMINLLLHSLNEYFIIVLKRCEWALLVTIWKVFKYLYKSGMRKQPPPRDYYFCYWFWYVKGIVCRLIIIIIVISSMIKCRNEKYPKLSFNGNERVK